MPAAGTPSSPHGPRSTSSIRSRRRFLNASCDKATFGWPCDAEMEKLRDAFARETDPAKQKAIAEAVQLRLIEYPTHLQLGQYVSAAARSARTSTGLLPRRARVLER